MVGWNNKNWKKHSEKRGGASEEDEAEIAEIFEAAARAADKKTEFEGGKGMKIPDNIVAAVNALLAPYGEKFTPGPTHAVSKSGYTNWGGAVKYTGLSKSTLQRAIKAGKLKPPHKMTESKNGTALFEFSELDRYIQSH